MKSKLTDDSLFCPACAARLTILGLQRCNSCGMECWFESNESHHAEQQIRLLLSWDAVLSEVSPTELGGNHW